MGTIQQVGVPPTDPRPQHPRTLPHDASGRRPPWEVPPAHEAHLPAEGEARGLPVTAAAGTPDRPVPGGAPLKTTGAQIPSGVSHSHASCPMSPGAHTAVAPCRVILTDRRRRPGA